MAEEAKWYVLHTYSGYENTVATTIMKHVDNRNLHDLIHGHDPHGNRHRGHRQRCKDGERKVFPLAMCLLKMVMTDESWRCTQCAWCHWFCRRRRQQGHSPSLMRGSGLGVENEVVVGYNVGDTVKINEGALESFLGTVEEIDIDKKQSPCGRLYVWP